MIQNTSQPTFGSKFIFDIKDVSNLPKSAARLVEDARLEKEFIEKQLGGKDVQIILSDRPPIDKFELREDHIPIPSLKVVVNVPQQSEPRKGLQGIIQRFKAPKFDSAEDVLPHDKTPIDNVLGLYSVIEKVLKSTTEKS